MNLKRGFITILIFICIGETMLRFDEYFHLFEDNRVVKSLTDISITMEYNMLINNTFPTDTNSFRVMVLGDSYISGAGLKINDNFSSQLKAILKNSNKKFDSIFVFDAGVPKNNNLDNNETYFKYVDKFKPNIIVLGYNYNDVMDNLYKKDMVAIPENVSGVKIRSSQEVEESKLRRLLLLAYNSKFVRYLHSKLYVQFKQHGIIFPGSEFDVMMKSYSQNTERWIISKRLLKEWIDDSKERKIKTIVLQCPQTDLMQYPHLFKGADSAIQQFFKSFSTVEYKPICEILKGTDPTEYLLSKYDGHSNAKAHRKIAETVYALIKASPSFKNRF